MEDDDKEITEDELKMLDGLDDIVAEARELSSRTEVIFDPHDENEWRDPLEKFLVDAANRDLMPVSSHPAFTVPIPAEPEIPLEVAPEPSKTESSIRSDKHLRKSFTTEHQAKSRKIPAKLLWIAIPSRRRIVRLSPLQIYRGLQKGNCR